MEKNCSISVLLGLAVRQWERTSTQVTTMQARETKRSKKSTMSIGDGWRQWLEDMEGFAQEMVFKAKVKGREMGIKLKQRHGLSKQRKSSLMEAGGLERKSGLGWPFLLRGIRQGASLMARQESVWVPKSHSPAFESCHGHHLSHEIEPETTSLNSSPTKGA